MAYLTVVIPAYNSEAYIARCLDSLLPQISDLDVIVVNDGSTDQTEKVADSYVQKFPDNIRLINKENGGHGSGVNVGMAEAKAPWFKVLDSDDRFDAIALARLIELIKSLETAAIRPELILTDFVYDVQASGEYEGHQKISDFHNVCGKPGMLSWSRMKSFRYDQLLMMHALCYRTDMLRKINLKLPEKTYYEDNIYAYEPLPHVRHIYYLDAPVYLYLIGRPDQSINMENVLKNVDMQIFVTQEMMRRVRLESVRPQRLQKYMYRHMSRMIAMCLMPLGIDGTTEAKEKIETFWDELENINPVAAKKLRAMPILRTQRLLAKAGSMVNAKVYNMISKVYIMN